MSTPSLKAFSVPRASIRSASTGIVAHPLLLDRRVTDAICETDRDGGCQAPVIALDHAIGATEVMIAGDVAQWAAPS
jgi:hypothetical protein